ncbi:FMN-binding protein [Perlucidibaca aquatica]|uniref:FMN-binding protein n=1 Tax=Perlucidibaca aquatica TaxID=1852776 RepID=UPI00083A7FAA|nr:FMN-binding protein [Perlucidibaca aquatica]
MKSLRTFLACWAGALLWIVALPASATQYLTLAEAQKAIFPEATEFQLLPLQLTPDQVKAIDKIADTDTDLPVKTTWKALNHGHLLGYFVIDHVIGKHEFIYFAAGIGPQGAVTGFEIMDYRETYGGQVRNPAWRQQFLNKQFGAPLQLNRDIQNISGATLSSAHLAKGMRRLLAFHQVVLK